MSVFSVRNLCAGYGAQPVIRDLSFDIERGSVTGLLGANGCGKTTLLKAICGILPHAGSCRLGDTQLERLPPRELARLCSYIPQRSGVLIDISVLDVVLMGFNPQLRLLAHPDAAMRQSALDALRTVGLEGMEQKNYQQLSEGQKQLCILARTLASGTQLLLLDEPESALDFRLRSTMLTLLGSITKKQQACALISLHDPHLALNTCDRLLLLSGGKLLGSIRPGCDPLSEMEAALGQLYGPVSLHALHTRSGAKKLVMLKEEMP